MSRVSSGGRADVRHGMQEKGQLLENVFADPKGFGIAPDGRYRYELPGFSSGTAAVS